MHPIPRRLLVALVLLTLVLLAADLAGPAGADAPPRRSIRPSGPRSACHLGAHPATSLAGPRGSRRTCACGPSPRSSRSASTSSGGWPHAARLGRDDRSHASSPHASSPPPALSPLGGRATSRSTSAPAPTASPPRLHGCGGSTGSSVESSACRRLDERRPGARQHRFRPRRRPRRAYSLPWAPWHPPPPPGTPGDSPSRGHGGSLTLSIIAPGAPVVGDVVHHPRRRRRERPHAAGIVVGTVTEVDPDPRSGDPLGHRAPGRRRRRARRRGRAPAGGPPGRLGRRPRVRACRPRAPWAATGVAR